LPPRIPPNAALPPASEKGVDVTFVPKTLAEDGAPKVAKLSTTLRGGELGDFGGELAERVGELRGSARLGRVGAYGEEP
jgi:F420-0:gamma-glutamyl ligase-like protein